MRPAIPLAIFLALTACSGTPTDNGATNSFPLSRSVWLDGHNVGTLPVHLFDSDNEDFNAANRIEGDASYKRQLPSRSFADASSVQTYTIIVGRNGSELQRKTIQLSGAEAKAGKNLSATWFDSPGTLALTIK